MRVFDWFITLISGDIAINYWVWRGNSQRFSSLCDDDFGMHPETTIFI